MKTHQKPTVKFTSNRSSSEKLNPTRCGFSNRKPTSTHTISTSICVIKKKMKKIDDFCEMSTFILFINVVLSSMINVMYLFFIKLLVQIIIQSDISLLRKLCMSRSRDT